MPPSVGMELHFIKHDISVSSLMFLLFCFLLLSIKGFFPLPEILWGFETHFKEGEKKKGNPSYSISHQDGCEDNGL